MKALREVRPPGVYPLGFESRITPITIAEAHVAGFVGLAVKGPLDTPCRLQNWNDFVEIYGAASDGYLARAVEGFFLNGGKTCYVVRVARRPKKGGPVLPEHAAPAERLIKDSWDKDTLRITALNEGRWGNNIWVHFAQSTGAQTLLTLDLPVGAGSARVNSTRGFEKGALVKISDHDHSDYVILTEIIEDRKDRRLLDPRLREEREEKTLVWDTSTPIMRSYAASAPTTVEVLEFEVHASLRDRREVFRGLQLSPLSKRYAPRVVNDQSRLIRVEDLHAPSAPPHHMPVAGHPERLAGGRDGVEGISAEDFVGRDHGMDDRTGLQTLAHVEEVGLLLVPDAMLAYTCGESNAMLAYAEAARAPLVEEAQPGPAQGGGGGEGTSQGVPQGIPQGLPPARRKSIAEARSFVQRIQEAMIAICELSQDRFAILDLPPTRDIEEVRRLRHRRESHYAAYYFPWLEVAGPGDRPIQVPPSGHIAGVFARCDLRYGVHKAPANEPLHGITQLTLPLTDDHIGRLNSEGVNTLRAFTGRGIRIWGARTISGDPDWRFVNVRRLFIMLRRALAVGTQWVSFEPNTPDTWSLVGREVSLFLRDLWMKGYFAGGTESDSFLVKCDAETNTTEGIDNGQLLVEIRVAPALPSEYILFTLEQKMGDQITGATGAPPG